MPLSKARGKSVAGHMLRRWLYLTHRWIGIASCLLFAIWFASGLVMIYVPYPSLTPAERVARLEPIDWGAVTAPQPDTTGLRSLALEMRDGHPVWRATPWEGDPVSLSAEAARPLAAVDAAMAQRIATRFAGRAVAGLGPVERDQWTVAQRYDPHRPLWKAMVGDAAGTEIYVSSSTGEVVQQTRRNQRFWNWVGAVPHWIYPTVLRQDGALWRQVVLWVAGPCIAAGVTGLWIGILRTRMGRRRFKGGRMTPYHGWMLWHHVAGMVGGIFLVCWIFSGWLSVDPGRIFHGGGGLPEGAERRYVGELSLSPTLFARLSGPVAGVLRVEAKARPGGGALILLHRLPNPPEVLDAASLVPAQSSQRALVTAATALMPGVTIAGVDRLTAPDAYWYSTDGAPRLPIIRIRFADAAATWVHVDPDTGVVLGTLDRRGRAYRWLFDLLHKWDLNMLTRNRPLWDLLLWTLSAAGLVTSISGVWIGWRRLMHNRR